MKTSAKNYEVLEIGDSLQIKERNFLRPSKGEMGKKKKVKWESNDAFILRYVGTVLGSKDVVLDETAKAHALA